MRATRFVLPLSGCLVLLSGCMYADTPEGRFGAIDIPLPVSSHTTINKTVTVNAPPAPLLLRRLRTQARMPLVTQRMQAA